MATNERRSTDIFVIFVLYEGSLYEKSVTSWKIKAILEFR